MLLPYLAALWMFLMFGTHTPPRRVMPSVQLWHGVVEAGWLLLAVICSIVCCLWFRHLLHKASTSSPPCQSCGRAVLNGAAPCPTCGRGPTMTCPSCKYDLSLTEDATCPECGGHFDRDTLRQPKPAAWYSGLGYPGAAVALLVLSAWVMPNTRGPIASAGDAGVLVMSAYLAVLPATLALLVSLQGFRRAGVIAGALCAVLFLPALAMTLAMALGILFAAYNALFG